MRKLRLVRVLGRVSVLGGCAVVAAVACGDFAELDAPADGDASDADVADDFDLDGPNPYAGAGGMSASSGGAPIRPLRPHAGTGGTGGDTHAEDAGASSGGAAGESPFGGHGNGGGSAKETGGTSGTAGLGASGGTDGAGARGGTDGAGARGGTAGLGARGGTDGAGARGGTGGAGARGGTGGVGARGGTNGMAGAGVGGRGGTGGVGSPGILFFSEYVEGTMGSRKALEIVASPARALDGCVVQIYFNGGEEPRVSVALSGEASPTRPFVVCYTQFVAESPGVCDASGNINYNGDDAIVLRCAGRVEDSIGRIGEMPNVSWGSGEVRTHDMTLRRTCSARRTADVEPTDSFEPSHDWIAAGTDAIDGLGVAECQATPAAG